MTQAAKYYKCEGEALDLLRAYKGELDALVTARGALDKEFEERYTKSQDHYRSNLQEIWRRMAFLVGLDHDETWGSPEYQIEARYLADGFGAVLFTPREPHPFQAGVGEEVDMEMPPEPTPDKSRMN